MEIETPKPQLKEEQRVLVYSPMVKHETHTNMEVMRIELDEEFTRIDFVYHASGQYANGGWVRIHDTCFIRPCNTELKLRMTKAVNIPIAPKRYHFKSSKGSLYYTLYFPPLPRDTKEIDIIELETNDPSYFNFYGVSVERIKREVIVVPN